MYIKNNTYICQNKQRNDMKKETIEQVVVLVIAVSAFVLSGLVR